MSIMGIDPGLSGGIAWLGERLGAPVALAYKMPETEADLWDLIAELKAWGVDKAYIELVRSSPQMGVVSAFTFGRGVGSLRMALIGNRIPFEEVTPSVWRKAMRLPKHESSKIGSKSTQAKNIAKQRARELFPNVTITHALSDALLIASYGRSVAK